MSPLSPVPPLPTASGHGKTFPSNDSVAAEAHGKTQRNGSERKQVAMAMEEKFFFLLGGGNSNILDFHPYLGKFTNLTNIFQRG